MVKEYEEVIGIDPAMFRRTGKKVIRVLYDELVHGIAAGNENGETVPRPPALPSRPAATYWQWSPGIRPLCMIPDRRCRFPVRGHWYSQRP